MYILLGLLKYSFLSRQEINCHVLSSNELVSNFQDRTFVSSVVHIPFGLRICGMSVRGIMKSGVVRVSDLLYSLKYSFSTTNEHKWFCE
jgi:hypothetical protein